MKGLGQCDWSQTFFASSDPYRSFYPTGLISRWDPQIDIIKMSQGDSIRTVSIRTKPIHIYWGFSSDQNSKLHFDVRYRMSDHGGPRGFYGNLSFLSSSWIMSGEERELFLRFEIGSLDG